MIALEVKIVINTKKVQIDDYFDISDGKFTLIGGPCSIENEEMPFKVAEAVKSVCVKLKINYIFKGSFDKANRSSLNAGRAVGMEKGLEILTKIKNTLNIPVTTDVHESWQCEPVGAVVDILQIPAYLCRQTDLLIAAAKTNKAVSVKKGQFMSPQNMDNVIEKIISVGNEKCILIERGSSFGYNKLVVDMTGLPVMRSFGYPVFIDVTHSVQEPGGLGKFTKGNREFAPLLMYAALAVGVDGVFAEIHPDPDNAVSDVGSQIKLSEIEPILQKAVAFNNIAWKKEEVNE
jgi:2-dehydro-3-deoxyphosphooctonate aldolase (KDO 8-P synthase)